MRDPNHPAWGFMRFALAIAALTVVLALNANNFDKTELRTIAEFAGIVGVGKVIGSTALGNKQTNRENYGTSNFSRSTGE